MEEILPKPKTISSLGKPKITKEFYS